jgi:hypothetical protein
MLAILKHSLSLYYRHFGWIVAFSLVTGLPLAIGNVLWAPFYFKLATPTDYNWAETFLRSLERILIEPITAGAILYFLAGREKNEPATGLGSLAAGLRAWPVLAATRFYIEIILFLSWNVLTLPGPYFYVKYCMADVFIMVEGSPRFEALQRSYELTEGRFWKLIGIFAMAAGLMCPLYIELPFETSILHYYGNAGYVVSSACGAVIFSFIHVVNWSVYLHLKQAAPTTSENLPLNGPALST